MNSNGQQPSRPLSTTKWAEYQRTYRNKNEETCSKCEASYRSTPEAKIKATARYKKWKELNKEKNVEYQKQYRELNKEKHVEYQKQYRKNNKEPLQQYREEYIKERLKNDVLFKIQYALRNAIYQAFKRIGKSKPTNTKSLLGCTWEEAKAHFESLFQEGMTWENHSIHGWHIDHIRPVSLFTEKDMHLMNHISNLQPLWAKDNLRKRDFYNN